MRDVVVNSSSAVSRWSRSVQQIGVRSIRLLSCTHGEPCFEPDYVATATAWASCDSREQDCIVPANTSTSWRVELHPVFQVALVSRFSRLPRRMPRCDSASIISSATDALRSWASLTQAKPGTSNYQTPTGLGGPHPQVLYNPLFHALIR